MWIRSFLFISLVAADAIAAPIYTWKDKDGTVHYSSKPVEKGAKEAKLPPIMRGEVKLTTSQLTTCDKHGGVNCQAGPDGDGSVICFDGFTSASTRFRFTCQTAKLEIADIIQEEESSAFKVLIRNSKSVVAVQPQVVFKPEHGARAALKGPKEIEGYGVGEFVYNGPNSVSEPGIANLDINCQNCP